MTIKKISFVITDMSNGGAERVMSLIANYFSEQGIDTQIIAIKSDTVVYPLHSNIAFKYIGQPHNPIRKFFYRLRIIRRETKGSDAVISFLWHCNLYTLLACMFTNMKVVISERSDPNREMRGRYRHLKWVRNLIYLRANKIVFQTEDAMNYYKGLLKRKGVVIPNPINPDLPEPYKGEREKVLYAAGRLTAQKNLKMLIEAFSIVHSKIPDYRLVIFGEGEDRIALGALIERLGLSSFIDMPGFTKDLAQNIRKGSLFLSTSIYEGISNSMIEALALGLPAIVTDCPVGGARQYVKSNENGILVNMEDKKAFAEALEYVITSPGIWEKYSKKAVGIREKLSINIIGADWIKVIS